MASPFGLNPDATLSAIQATCANAKIRPGFDASKLSRNVLGTLLRRKWAYWCDARH